MNMQEWMNHDYLPAFMRDFHDQKDIFKRINEMVEKRKEKNIKDNKAYWNDDYPNWVGAHIYVIDFFLWYMALCGYTLQKSRRHFEFQDMQEDLADYKREYLKRMDKAMGLHPIDEADKE